MYLEPMIASQLWIAALSTISMDGSTSYWWLPMRNARVPNGSIAFRFVMYRVTGTRNFLTTTSNNYIIWKWTKKYEEQDQLKCEQ